MLLSIFFGIILSGMKGPIAQASAEKIMFGELSLAFWIVLIGMGLIGPLLFYSYNFTRKHGTVVKGKELTFGVDSIPIPAVSITGEEAATSHGRAHVGSNKTVVILCNGAVMVWGLAMRCLIVFAATPVWNVIIG